jgi:hypothetical protein
VKLRKFSAQEVQGFLATYGIITLLFVASAYATLINWPHFAQDSRYYYAMALHFGGHSEVESRALLETLMTQLGVHGEVPDVSKLFHWGLVEPRVLLPLLAVPFVAIAGYKGFLLLQVLLTYALVVLLFRFVSKSYGRAAAFVVALLYVASHYIMYFSMSLLTEPLTMLLTLLLLFAARSYLTFGRSRTLLWVGGVVLLLAFTRQATFVAALAFVCAWLGALILRHNSKKWGMLALVVGGVALVVQVLQSILFPFSQLNEFLKATKSSNLFEAILNSPALAIHIFSKDFQTLMKGDLVLVAIILLSFASVFLFWRRPESHLAIGAFAGAVLYNVTNGTTTQFRYSLPALDFYLLVIAVLVASFSARDKTSEITFEGLEIPNDATRKS